MKHLYQSASIRNLYCGVLLWYKTTNSQLGSCEISTWSWPRKPCGWRKPKLLKTQTPNFGFWPQAKMNHSRHFCRLLLEDTWRPSQTFLAKMSDVLNITELFPVLIPTWFWEAQFAFYSAEGTQKNWNRLLTSLFLCRPQLWVSFYPLSFVQWPTVQRLPIKLISRDLQWKVCTKFSHLTLF
jgi:hypothetical protein